MTIQTSTGAAPSATPAGRPLLRLTNLTKHFPQFRQTLIKRPDNPVRAVDGISFDVAPGQTVGLVGESGCGKSTAGRTLLRLLEPTAGTIEFEGRDITHAKGAELRTLRREMQMIFQDPYGSLNPRLRVGTTVAEGLRVHSIVPRQETDGRVGELLELVGHPIRVVRRGEGLLSGDASRHAFRQGPVDRRAHDSPPTTVRSGPTRTTESERDPTEVQPSSLG